VKPPNRNLVLSPIGDESVHQCWLSGGETPAFDLCLVYYGSRPSFGRDDATYYLQRVGFKYELFDHVAREHAPILRSYANIWCPDHDIRVDAAGINRMFALFEKYRLQMAQPAIANGDITYQTMRPQPGVILRYTPFVEVMCPLFTREAFWRVLPTFLESRSSWGLDIIWPRFFGPQEMAILDQTPVEHCGELFRGDLYQKLAALGVSPRDELLAIAAKFGGISPELHRQLREGSIRLPAVREPQSG